jgi:hypothetical protein
LIVNIAHAEILLDTGELGGGDGLAVEDCEEKSRSASGRQEGKGREGKGREGKGKRRTVEKEHQDQRRHDPNVELASSIATMSSELFRRETCETGSETGGDELSMLDRGFCRFEVDLARVVGKVSRC